MSTTTSSPLDIAYGNFTKACLFSIQHVIETERDLQNIFRKICVFSYICYAVYVLFVIICRNETPFKITYRTGFAVGIAMWLINYVFAHFVLKITPYNFEVLYTAYLFIGILGFLFLLMSIIDVFSLNQLPDRVVTVTCIMMIYMLATYPFQMYALPTLLGYQNYWHSFEE